MTSSRMGLQMTDQERTHRWLTQAELDDMLQNEYKRGISETAWLLSEALNKHGNCLPCVPDCVWSRIEMFLAGVDENGGSHE